jgi:Icc-related predicted phosphoesterase
MFVRKKRNRSGTISVVIVSKAHGKFTEVKKFGVANSEEDADALCTEATIWLRTHDGQQEFDFNDSKRRELDETERVIGNKWALPC